MNALLPKIEAPRPPPSLNPDIAIEGKIELQKKRKTNKYAPFQ
jgi:hypothetical protein